LDRYFHFLAPAAFQNLRKFSLKDLLKFIDLWMKLPYPTLLPVKNKINQLGSLGSGQFLKIDDQFPPM